MSGNKYIYKAVRFASELIAARVNAASTIVAREITGNPTTTGNRSAFIAEASLSLAKAIEKAKLSSKHYLPITHRPRTEKRRCLVLLKITKPRKFKKVLCEVTGWSSKYVDLLLKTVPTLLLEDSEGKELEKLQQALKGVAHVTVQLRGKGVRTNVTLMPKELELIEKAAFKCGHSLSSFLSWAAMLRAYKVLDIGEKGVERFLTSPGGKNSLTRRIPTDLLRHVDEACSKREVSRSQFVEEALKSFLKVVEEDRLSAYYWTSPYARTTEMVSVQLDEHLISRAVETGARVNHHTTAFLWWALAAYLLETNNTQAISVT